MQNMECGADVVGFKAAGIERAALHQMAGKQVFGIALEDLGDRIVRLFQIAADLAFADLPGAIRHILPNIGELGAREDQLRDLVNAPRLGCPVGLRHKCALWT